jgi:CrcB protein
LRDAHPGAQWRTAGENTTEDTAKAGAEDKPEGHDAGTDEDRHAATKPRHLPMDPDVPEQAAVSASRRAVRVLQDRWDILLVIAAGGALGSVARWGVTAALPHPADGVPWATWLENVTGAFILGALMVLILDVWPPSRFVRPFWGVGVLGGYTTFSTYMLDTRTLLGTGQVPAAFGYLFGTLLTGLLAVWAGVLLARAAVTAAERRHQHRHARRRSQDPDRDLDARSGR